MAVQDHTFLDQRVRALATMYLTHRKDLALNFDEKERGIDLLVDILPTKRDDDAVGKRMFGVELRGASGSTTAAEAQKQFKMVNNGKRRVPRLPFPLCVFLFTMTDNQGYFAWLIEPSIQDGLAKLRTVAEKPLIRILDNMAIDEIIESVNRWYDVFYTTISV